MKHFICDFKIWVTLLLNLIIRTAHAGHEVLYKFASSQPALEIQPEELLVIQYDSRPLSSYWNTTARWNKAFCDRFGHRYLYLSVYNRNLSCSISSRGAGIGTNLPTAPGSILLAEPWCKVKAMMIADRIFADSSTKAFLFMDSDALITVRNYSMTTVLNFLQQDLGWDMIHQPFAFNQDGPGWACKFTTSLRIGYQLCLNSGTVFWRRNALSTAILTDWWRSAGAPYTSNRFPPKWRLRVRLQQVYIVCLDTNIQVVEHPTALSSGLALSYISKLLIPTTSK